MTFIDLSAATRGHVYALWTAGLRTLLCGCACLAGKFFDSARRAATGAGAAAGGLGGGAGSAADVNSPLLGGGAGGLEASVERVRAQGGGKGSRH